MTTREVKINEWLLEGFNVYKEHFGVLLVGSLIAVLLSAVTLGILAGPLTAGLALMALRLYDGEGGRVQPGDVFQGFRFFLNALLFFLVWGLGVGIVTVILGLVPVLGKLAVIAVYLGASSLLMFGLYLIVDQGYEFWPASLASIEMVRSNLWPFVGFGAIAVCIGQVGFLICAIGVILTLPLQFTMIAVAYREVFSGVATAAAAPARTVPEEAPDSGAKAAAAAEYVLAGGEVSDDQEPQDIVIQKVDEEDMEDPDET